MNVKIITDTIVKARSAIRVPSSTPSSDWAMRAKVFSDDLHAACDLAVSEIETGQLQEAYTSRLYRYSWEQQILGAISDVEKAIDGTLESASDAKSAYSSASSELRMEYRSALLTSYNCLVRLLSALKPCNGPETAEPSFIPMPPGYDEFSWASEVDTTVGRTVDESKKHYATVFDISKLNKTMEVGSQERFLSRPGKWNHLGGGVTNTFMDTFNELYWFLVEEKAIVDTDRNYSLLLLRFSGRSVYLHDNDSHIYWYGGENEFYFFVMKAIERYREDGRSKGEDASRFFRFIDGGSVKVPESSGTITAPYAKLAGQDFMNRLSQIIP